MPEPPPGLFLLSTGTGIGGGFIKHGELFVGDSDRGMEIGHLVMVQQGPLCRCGNRGCLEALCGEAGIRRKVEEALENGVETKLRNADFSLEHFIQCAREDRAAGIIAGEVCEYLARGLSIVVTLLNPSHVVIAGELAGLGTLLTDTVTRTLRTNCVLGTADKLKVELSSLGRCDAARGAVLYLRRQMLAQSIL